ncbi:MAG: hypothetical protein CMG46_14015 [Candidatus Marinimicrobia bacterium]|nr:hypothetical protein [Candidatus Neomarinimicrobiota bacterium]
MLSQRKQEERKVRKEAIIKGALKVFNNSGIDKTTMDEIAKESGFGKATLYYYFSSKEEVFIEIMNYGWIDLWKGIENDIISDLNPREKFISIVKAIAKIVTADKILYGFLFTAPNYIQEPDNESWKKYQNRLYSVLQSIIEEGVQKKEFLDINPGLLMKAIGGLFHQLLINNDDELKDEDLELMLKNFLNPK